MNGTRSARIYQGVLHCYPRAFRNYYGDDMVLLFQDQMRDEQAVRVWIRSALDLIITVPNRHLEAHVDRPPRSVVPFFFAAVSVTAVLLGLVYGSNLGWLTFGLAVGIAAGSIAVVAARGTRGIARPTPVSAHWLTFVIIGAVALGTFIAVTTTTGTLDHSWWLPMMLVLLAAIGTLAAGLVLGVARFTGNHANL